MKFMSVKELRENYLKFFEEKGHIRLKSYSLVPENDKSLLLINSGMAPLKAFFMGQEVPPKNRVTTCQKCIRTGDIENVGKTDRHGTFFEMLGNFSFADYFKKEALEWALEFCTKVLNLSLEKIYISVYYEDEETYNIWNKDIGIPKNRLVKLGKEDNFWEVGVGPCGPCSELYYDRGKKYGCGNENCGVGCSCDRYIEFWNIVFTQYYKEEDGSYSKFKNKNIDTGMGLERMAVIMQNVDSLFDIDTIKTIRDKVSEKAKVKYGEHNKKDISIRIITDHVRSITFMCSDGILPSNEGRGYVLRRLIRRAARHGKILEIGNLFLVDLCKIVVDEFKDIYFELEEKKDYILKVVHTEEKRFYETLDQGMEKLKEIIFNLKSFNIKIMSGKDAFKMYDTYGFPLELLIEILEEENLEVDEIGFNNEMENQRNRARESREIYSYMGCEKSIYEKLDIDENTNFLGYINYHINDAIIRAIVIDDKFKNIARFGDKVEIILDKTTLYAESGGQVGDRGIIKTKDGEIRVLDCIKVSGGRFAHIGEVTKGQISLYEKAEVIVDKYLRDSIARNHTATHLLHKTLKDVLGSHIQQAGSHVSAERLRFDFTHFVAMTNDEIDKVEEIINKKILDSLNIEILEKNIDDAKNMGATALFGEKYKDIVRVVNINDYSIELCGGTHVKNTSNIGSFKIISETGISSGIRRIEAITGLYALDYYKKQQNFLNKINILLNSNNNNMIKKLDDFIEESKLMKLEIEKLNFECLKNKAEKFLKEKILINNKNVILVKVKDINANNLRILGDQLKNKLKSGIVILFDILGDKVNILVMLTFDLSKNGAHAGNIIKELASVVDGKGGGGVNMAQARGNDVSKIDKAIKLAKEIIYNLK